MTKYNFEFYKHTSKTTGKSYIGLTMQGTEFRWNKHCYDATERNSKYHFHRAIRKYGVDDWTHEIIQSGLMASEDASKIERELIAEHDTYHNGYNSTLGGDAFTDPEWQRDNQLKRVANGVHPFSGGSIQSETQSRLWKEGKHHFIGGNQRRIAAGTHHFVGDSNPTRKLVKEGKQHNQLKRPWQNSKATKIKDVWAKSPMAYDWFHAKGGDISKRGCGYGALSKFLGCGWGPARSIIKLLSEGWNPTTDPDWINDFRLVS